MTSEDDLADMLGKGLAKSDSQDNKILKPGSIGTQFLIGKWILKNVDKSLEIKERDWGNAFILGHPTNGVLGTSATLQPVLGSGTLGAFSEVENQFNETDILEKGLVDEAIWLRGSTATAQDPTHFAWGSGTTPVNKDDTTLVSELNRKIWDTKI